MKGSVYDGNSTDYYGNLTEVLELNYLNGRKVMLFRCHWFDTRSGVKVDKKTQLVMVDVKSRLNTDDVFVLASQATQVLYVPSVVNPRAHWYSVVTTRPLPLDETIAGEALQEDLSNASATPSPIVDPEWESLQEQFVIPKQNTEEVDDDEDDYSDDYDDDDDEEIVKFRNLQDICNDDDGFD